VTRPHLSTKAAVLLTTLVAFGAAAAGAGATHSNGQGPKRDLVAGTGTFSALEGKVHVNARSDRSGDGAKGHFRIRLVGTDLRGRVTCLTATGNVAVAGGRVTRGESTSFPGSGVLIEIRDNGEGRPTRDEFGAGTIPEPPPTCPADTNLRLVPTDSGNFVVHDAQGEEAAGDDAPPAVDAGPVISMFP
jgi:hypothetical protein